MEFILIALVTAFNILVIKHKLEHKRFEDGILDGTILVLLSLVFGGSYGGLVVATVTSLIISLYFLASPPAFFSGFLSEFKKRARRSHA